MSNESNQGHKPSGKTNVLVQQNYLVRLMALDGEGNKTDMNAPLKIRGAFSKYEAIERFNVANGIIRSADEYEVTELGEGTGPEIVGHFSRIQWDDALEHATGPNKTQKMAAA